MIINNSKNFDKESDKIGEWDLDFATKCEKEKILNEFFESDFSQYFHLNNVIKGFETLINHLYGLYFKFSWPKNGEIWPGNVLKLVF